MTVQVYVSRSYTIDFGTQGSIVPTAATLKVINKIYLRQGACTMVRWQALYLAVKRRVL